MGTLGASSLTIDEAWKRKQLRDKLDEAEETYHDIHRINDIWVKLNAREEPDMETAPSSLAAPSLRAGEEGS